MKIAVDFREACRDNKTGKGWHAYNLMQNVLEQDADNEYIFYVDDNAAVGKISAPNVNWRVINKKSIFWHLAVLRELKSAPAKTQPDIFFAPTSFIIPALAPKTLKTVIIVHDLIAFLFPYHNKKAVFIEKMTCKSALKKAAAIIAISENTKKDLTSLFHPPLEKISIIHPAASDNFKKLSKEEIEKFREKHNLPDQFILAVGTLEPRKNFTTLIEAFARAALDFPHLKLIIIGEKGWGYQQIFKRAAEQNLSDKIIFRGYVGEQDLIYYYNAAEAFVFPSLYEGFGIPPLEAMKCGCPVIASNTSSMPEVIGNAGLLIDPKNEKDLRQAIKSILTNQKLRKKLIKEGFKQSQKFSYKNSAARFLNILNIFKK